MKFDIITAMPHIFDSYFNESIIERAVDKKIIKIKIHNLRDFTSQKHRKIDDKPYGGGAGMVFMAEPIMRAVGKVLANQSVGSRSRRLKKRTTEKLKTKIIVFSAKGKQFNQKMAYDWAKKFHQIVFITGRYEGIDERALRILKADSSANALATVEEISIGPYIMTDGDVAAMVIISAVTRLIPGVINWRSLKEESYFNGFMKKEENKNSKGNFEYPHYTRPEILEWRGKKYKVPEILLTGDHKKINAWRREHQR